MVTPEIKAKLTLVADSGPVDGGGEGGGFTKSENRSFRLEQLKSFKSLGMLAKGAGGLIGAIGVGALAGSLLRNAWDKWVAERDKKLNEIRDFLGGNDTNVQDEFTEGMERNAEIIEEAGFTADANFKIIDAANQDYAGAVEDAGDNIKRFNLNFFSLIKTIEDVERALKGLGIETDAVTKIFSGKGGELDVGGSTFFSRAQQVDPTGELSVIRLISENAAPGMTSGDAIRLARQIVKAQGQSE